MLVITRRPSECLRVGNDIKIKVVRINGGSVCLSIEAPNQTSIVRAEEHDQVPALDVQPTNVTTEVSIAFGSCESLNVRKTISD